MFLLFHNFLKFYSRKYKYHYFICVPKLKLNRNSFMVTIIRFESSVLFWQKDYLRHNSIEKYEKPVFVIGNCTSIFETFLWDFLYAESLYLHYSLQTQCDLDKIYLRLELCNCESIKLLIYLKNTTFLHHKWSTWKMWFNMKNNHPLIHSKSLRHLFFSIFSVTIFHPSLLMIQLFRAITQSLHFNKL